MIAYGRIQSFTRATPAYRDACGGLVVVRVRRRVGDVARLTILAREIGRTTQPAAAADGSR
jgi:hypothetical protein